MEKFHHWLPKIILFLMFIPLAVLFVAEAYLSLDWRMVHDSPILYYMGYLVSHFGAVPYRDFFDMNMPGAHWLNALIGSLFGFNDAGFQRANLSILLITMGLIFYWLRSFGFWPGMAGSILFGVSFYQYGPTMSMQREFIILPFILMAMIIFPYSGTGFRIWRFFMAGFFIGLSILIKPQSGLFLILFLILSFYPIKKSVNRKTSYYQMLFFFLGSAIPILAVIIYFVINQSLTSFLEVAFKYWPLYGQINSQMEIASGFKAIRAHLDGLYSIGIKALLFAPALMGFQALSKNKFLAIQEREKSFVMVGGVLVSLLEVVFANKYWEYHWLPMMMFLILLSVAGLASPPFRARPQNAWISICSLILVLAFVIRPPVDFWNQLESGSPTVPQGGRVDEVANYLKVNLEPGDTVQPLDWAKGAVHSMFIVKATPASRYLYDFYFYHHISNPEIQFMRQDFIKQISISKPKVIIQYYDGRPWVSGLDTTREFPELQQFLIANYYVDKDKNGYRLWMRK